MFFRLRPIWFSLEKKKKEGRLLKGSRRGTLNIFSFLPNHQFNGFNLDHNLLGMDWPIRSLLEDVVDSIYVWILMTYTWDCLFVMSCNVLVVSLSVRHVAISSSTWSRYYCTIQTIMLSSSQNQYLNSSFHTNSIHQGCPRGITAALFTLWSHYPPLFPQSAPVNGHTPGNSHHCSEVWSKR